MTKKNVLTLFILGLISIGIVISTYFFSTTQSILNNQPNLELVEQVNKLPCNTMSECLNLVSADNSLSQSEKNEVLGKIFCDN